MRFANFIALALAGPVLACESVDDLTTRLQFIGDTRAAYRDYSAFAVLGPAKPTETIHIDALDDRGHEFVRDILVAARLGYNDFSELYALGIVDTEGRVIDLNGLFAQARRQINFPSMGENWSAGEEAWARARFDIIKIQEIAAFDFEANLSLLLHKESGEYFISIGGTDSFGDVLSDLQLYFRHTSGPSFKAIRDEVDRWFAKDIPSNARVNLVGHSLGGGEAVALYRANPERFKAVYPVQAVGLGGRDGSYYDLYLWDKIGDAKITEVIGDDPGPDFNDAIVSWGHIGAGTVICIAPTENPGESERLGPDPEIYDSHNLGNMWESF